MRARNTRSLATEIPASMSHGIISVSQEYHPRYQVKSRLNRRARVGIKVEEPIPDSLSFKQLSMAFIERCLKNV
jgi:hypothetical protein